MKSECAPLCSARVICRFARTICRAFQSATAVSPTAAVLVAPYSFSALLSQLDRKTTKSPPYFIAISLLHALRCCGICVDGLLCSFPEKVIPNTLVSVLVLFDFIDDTLQRYSNSDIRQQTSLKLIFDDRIEDFSCPKRQILSNVNKTTNACFSILRGVST